MVSLQPHLNSLLKSLPPHPIEQHKLDDLVSKTLADANDKASAENRKSQWEYLLKNEIFTLAATEGKALKDETTSYYNDMRDRLDLVLTFTEHDACEQTFPFVVLQDLLETQTIASCSHIFSWIEARASRLTEGMVPQKGKALILLRTLNDLLRRLSKMGTTTIFCGRILTFLSGVFPLGERSGVNLRGEYGPTWEGVKFTDRTKGDEDADMDPEDSSETLPSQDSAREEEKMQVDTKDGKKPSVLTSTEKKEDFYNTFWSLQLPFSKPPLFASKDTFAEFREAVNKVMPVIKEATAKERAMMGSRVGAAGPSSLKRKREPDAEETNTNEYFFAKLLTSPDLLELEIADTHFRRQFLFQLLILLSHLLTFTKAAKASWQTPRNRSLQMDFTLEPAEAQWVQEMLTKAIEEFKQTTPNGRAFADTINTILEREKNWVRWKNDLCAPFDKEPWSAEVNGNKVGLLEATKGVRDKMREPVEDWKWRLGTEPLTEIWEMGYKDLSDLQNPFQPGDVKDFVKKIKQEDARIELRRKNLTKTAERLAAAQRKASEAAAAAAKPPTPAPVIKEPSTPAPKESTSESAEDVPMTIAEPQPVSSADGTNVHPSLPAKPGSPSKPLSSSQDSAKAGTPPPVATPTPAPAPAPKPVLPPDSQIAKFEENKQRWAWLALRTARDQHLQHFGKIGTGDVELLQKEIEQEAEKERLEQEKMQKEEDMSGVANVNGATEGRGSDSPVNAGGASGGNGSQATEVLMQSVEGDGDVKME